MVAEFVILATTAFVDLEDKVENQVAIEKKRVAAKREKESKIAKQKTKALVNDANTSADDDKEGEKIKDDVVAEVEQNITPSVADEGEEDDDAIFIVQTTTTSTTIHSTTTTEPVQATMAEADDEDESDDHDDVETDGKYLGSGDEDDDGRFFVA
ncbi:hypothetical protein L6452_31142 [Arctium lappa]|uniref:Uncharacterized protein n=1 Tax=Arctium lappa TaxID=4217 RepID=A0ACB8ZJ44_ARCLA|nr:hypothetical protein L6452_31142 [Arctium lappa]